MTRRQIQGFDITTISSFSIGKFLKTGLFVVLLMILINSGTQISAQPEGTSQPQNKETANKADQNLKSIARVNPSTLAMEMDVPLMTYPGRNGNSLPVGFSYSSKLWRMQSTEPWWYWANTQPRYITDIIPMFSEKKVAGWTSNLVPPRVEEQTQVYDENGQPYRPAIDVPRLNQVWQNILQSFTSNSSLGSCVANCDWMIYIEDSQTGAVTSYCNRWSFDPFCSNDPGGSSGGGNNPPVPLQLYYVRKFQIAMPDGANYEFRAADIPVHCGNTSPQVGCVISSSTNGTYLSVDGSGTKYVRDDDGSTLFMPNGSRYRFPSVSANPSAGNFATEYIDADGNKLTFSSTNSSNGQAINRWIDTLGREITDPMYHNLDIQRQMPGRKDFSLPGLNNQPQNYSMTFARLKPPGCETDTDPGCRGTDNTNGGALEDQSQKLFYDTRYFCRGNLITDLLAHPEDLNHPDNEVLFPLQDNGIRPCTSFDVERNADGSLVLDNEGNVVPFVPRFNPTVLTEIELPNRKKYEFKYNRFGEITKITYPTGSYETFEYAKIEPIGSAESAAYDQTNRGVIKREVYRRNSGGSYTLEQSWQYSAGISNYNNLYKVTTTAPKGDDANGNGVRTERYLFPSSAAGYNFGFDSPLGGMMAEERTYAENDYTNPRSRTITQWTTKNSVINNNVVVSRDARVKRTVSVMIENGRALAGLSETEYNEPEVEGSNPQTDAEYFSHLNVKRTKGYHYAVIPMNLAQTGTLAQIAAYFNNNLLASVAETDYQYNPDYKARGIASLPTETRVLNPQNTSEIIAKTQTVYDESGAIGYNSGTLSATLSATWTNPGFSFRGKPTTAKVWDSDNSVWIETHTQFDQYGNVRKVWEASTAATFDETRVAETFYDGVNNYVCANGQTCPQSYAYPTRVITPAPDPSDTTGTSQKSEATTTYDFMTGLTLTATALNDLTTSADDQTTATEYNDALLRPTRTYAVNFSAPEAQTIYNDDNNNLFVKVRKQIDATNWDEAISYMDSLGRTYKTQAKDSQGDVFVETEYDLLGRVKRATNPYRLTDLESGGVGKIWTQPRYDAVGRVFETCTALSGAALAPTQACPVGTSTGVTQFDISTETGYVGTTVTATDASGRKSRSLTNGLGQLTRVDEPSSTNTLEPLPQATPSPNPLPSPTPGGGGHQCAANCNSLNGNDYGSLSTYYVYNVQGQMVKVMQGGQSRYFKYDSLGRLIRVRQPEQEPNYALDLADDYNTSGKWTAKFTYDFLGKVLTTTDAKGTTITNEYDKAGRVTKRTYSDGTTPQIEYFYDGKGLTTQQSPNFAKGKLTKVTSSISETRYTTFDNLGRLTQSRQITDGTTYTSGYEYNFAGALVKETYPSGRVVENQFEADGDLSRIYGKANANATERTYANSFLYTADGRISQLKLGNGLWESAKFNNRLQVTEFNLGIGVNDASKWKLEYQYGELNSDGSVDTNKNTGNIAKQISSFAGLANPFVQTFKYDSLYRLIEAKETVGTNPTPTWQQNFGYDRFGNRIAFTDEINGQVQTNTNLTHPSIDANTNRFNTGQGYVFDKNGNLTTSINPLTSLGRSFTFNGENKQTEVRDASNPDPQTNVIGKYYYDGEGKRVKKETATEITVFVYSNGKLVAEYSTAPPPTNPTTSYTMTDQLDSPRVITNALGEVTNRRDFKPFGEEITPETAYRTAARKYGVTDNIRQKFTGYQKDTETQLDFAEARMYQNLHGRFTAVDPLLASGKSANPQTFNRFVYCLNNPLINTDPTGLQTNSSPNKVKPELPYEGPVYVSADGGSFSSTQREGYIPFEGNEIRYKNGIAYRVYSGGWFYDANNTPVGTSQPSDLSVLAESVPRHWNEGINAIFRGIGNFGIENFNHSGFNLMVSGGSYLFGQSNPFQIERYKSDNPFGAGYSVAAETGLNASTIVVGGYFSGGGALPSVVPRGSGGGAFSQASRTGLTVNLGGEGEVANAINVQGKWVLNSTWRSSRTGQSLGELQRAGNQFLVADNAALPFANQSIQRIVTNNVPINTNTWLGSGVRTSEIWRTLQPNGIWVNNGRVMPRP